MKTYTVKQIADMLNTKPETVRRWIRSGKLKAKKNSRKEGNIVAEDDLEEFLKTSPKHAGMIAATTATVAALASIPVAPLIGGSAATMSAMGIVPMVASIVTTYMNANKKDKEVLKQSVSKDDLTKYLCEEVKRRQVFIDQKLKTIEQMQNEITNDQKQLSELKLILKKLKDNNLD